MDIFDNEINIIECFQDIADTTSKVLLIGNTSECKTLYSSIIKAKRWKNWKNSSGKADPPPDFYSDRYGYMMDVMRVDDHGYISPKGKTVNPTRQRESELTRELKEKGILDVFPHARLLMTVDTQLPTREDHNYVYYRDNFIRVIEAHKKKISSYQSNHPSLKTVFFVFDESSQYMQTSCRIERPEVGKIVQARPHFWWGDESFITAFYNSEIDFVIWFTPYKHCQMYDPLGNKVDLPVATIIDVKSFKIDAIKYNADLMESVEI